MLMMSHRIPLARCTVTLVALLLLPLTLSPFPLRAAPLDADTELRVVKAAYDALRTNLFTAPDTRALLMNAYQVAQQTLDRSLPLDPLDGDADAQWTTFAQGLHTLLARSTATTLAPGELAHLLVGSFARTVADPHTFFIPAPQAAILQRITAGDAQIVNFGFTAIGVGNAVYVKQVLPGSPMAEAGARNDDHILTVDGRPLTAARCTSSLSAPPVAQALSPDECTGLPAAPQDGETHAVAVQHVGEATPTTLTVRLHAYSPVALDYRVLDGHIGYLQTFLFLPDIAQELDRALTAFDAQHVDSLILDLRGNAGGTAVTQVMGRFLPAGTLLGVSQGRTEQLRLVAQGGSAVRWRLPVVVLVDEASASASEIAALAFHDFAPATLLGTRTAGALGSVRRVALGDGSALSITTSLYTSAIGEALDTVGVTPDFLVARTAADVVAGQDPPLDDARVLASGAMDGRGGGPR